MAYAVSGLLIQIWTIDQKAGNTVQKVTGCSLGRQMPCQAAPSKYAKLIKRPEKVQKGKSFSQWLWVVSFKIFKMPSTNSLSFLRPLYDIAVWQFILMRGYHRNPASEEQPHIKFTWKMHEVVAIFLCKLLEVRAFQHLQSKLLGEEVKSATGNWNVGQRAWTKLVEWCQDQWRRKEPCLPQSYRAYFDNEPSTVP